MYYAKYIYIISAKSRVLYLVVVVHIGNYMGIFLCDKAKKCIQKCSKLYLKRQTYQRERERERERAHMMRRFFQRGKKEGERDHHPAAGGGTTGGRRLSTPHTTEEEDHHHRGFASGQNNQSFFGKGGGGGGGRGGWHDDRGPKTSSFQNAGTLGGGGGRDFRRSRERYHDHHASPPVVRGGGGGRGRHVYYSPYDRNVGNTGGRRFDAEVGGGSGFSRARRNGGRGYAAATGRRNDRSMHDNRRPMIHQTRRSATTREGSGSDAKKKEPTALKEKSEKELEDDLEAYFAEGRSLKEKAAKEAVLTSGE